MNHKIILPVLIALIFISSGCTQLEKVQEGGENVICLARGDYDCVKQAYGPSTWNENGDSEDNNYSEMEEIGVVVSELDVEDAVKSYNTTGIIKIENKGGEDLVAENVRLNLQISGKVSFIGNNSFEVPIEWSMDENIEEIPPGETETLSFDVPSSKNPFTPEESDEYKDKCEEDCMPEDLPWSFDSDLTITYKYKAPVVFDYRIYDREYYESHAGEADKELEEYCTEYKGSKAQVSSTSDDYNSPVSIKAYARSCTIFEDERFPLTVSANSEQEFEILEDEFLISNNCEKESDLKGNSSDPVKWSCDMKAPENINRGETKHLIFELPYEVHMKKEYPDSFSILKE